MSQSEKKKSHQWSLKEVKQIATIVSNAKAAGKTRVQGMDEAAAHFGVTRNAISIRYGRYLRSESVPPAKNTIKKPTKGEGVPRTSYKRRTTKPVSEERSVTLKIKDVKIDLKSGEIKIIY